MSSAMLKMLIESKKSDIAKTEAALESHKEHQNYLISVFEQDIHELNVKLQMREAEEKWQITEEQEEPCYYCGRYMHSCICAQQKEDPMTYEQTDYDEFPKEIGLPPMVEERHAAFKRKSQLSARAAEWRKPRTKMTWSLSDATYRVAVITKKGILQVKSVTGGVTDTGLKSFFISENMWRDSLPEGGSIIVTQPPMTQKEFKELCIKPLKETTDALRLKELEERFPGATMVLTTDDAEYVVKYIYEDFYEDTSINHMVSCECCDYPRLDFKSLGATDTPRLVAHWRGLDINLSHLF
jgi:hypothetical protein